MYIRSPCMNNENEQKRHEEIPQEKMFNPNN